MWIPGKSTEGALRIQQNTMIQQINPLVSVAETGADIPPSLKDFDEEIQRYKAMEKSMRVLKTRQDIGWVRVDAQPLKKSLESLVSKWSYLYIKYLQVRLHTGDSCE